MTSFCLPLGGKHHACLLLECGDLEDRSLSNLAAYKFVLSITGTYRSNGSHGV